MRNIFGWLIWILICCELSLVLSVDFYYTLPRRSTHCFEENLSDSIAIFGRFSMPNNGPVMIKLFDPDKFILQQEALDKENSSPFATIRALTKKGGNYKMCIENQGTAQTELHIILLLGVDADANFTQIANTTQPGQTSNDTMSATTLIPVQRQMERVERLTSQLHHELNFLRQKEEDMRDANEATSTKIVVFGIITLVILIFSSFMQVNYLKKFFKAKKII